MKSTTVIKRMVHDSWKPMSIILGTILVISIASTQAEKAFGIDRDIVYFGLIGLWFLGAMIKWAYESTKSRIEFEQAQMLRAMGKKND